MFKIITFAFVVFAVAEARFDAEAEWIEKLEDLEKWADENGANKNAGSNSRKTGTFAFNVDLECSPTPSSVHELRPHDIDVIGAMGDSFTAGSGAEATLLAELGIEYRGLSWTIGGEGTLNTTLTITNILRKFNPAIKGYSTGVNNEATWFNAAVPGTRSREMPEQAFDLIDRMQNDSRTNYENDWKLISIFIGANDLCALGLDVDSTPENYVETLKQALDILHGELPRALVNVIDILDISVLPELGSTPGASPECTAAQTIICNNVISANEVELQEIRAQNRLYQNLTKQLIDSGRYDTRDDFTVVLQPFLRDTELARTENGDVDSSFFAPDCFHFSSKGHAMGALNLWNNMLQPVGNKTTTWNVSDLNCPTKEQPYIYTRLNSGVDNGFARRFQTENDRKKSDNFVSNAEKDWADKLESIMKIRDGNSQMENVIRNPRVTGINFFNVSLDCSPVPTSVHELRPRDIGAVGAMGDSITAGSGADANTVPGIAVSYGGISWTIGGDETLNTSITIPNILRNFNPAVKGYALGVSPPNNNLWFNAAVPGARSRNMPNQARDLIERMQNDSRTNYENDWKLISIFIGGNDLCALNRDDDASPERYLETLQEGLDILHAELPRALVNVIDILEIYLLPQVGTGAGSTPACRAAQATFCNYVVTANDTEEMLIREKNTQYQILTKQLIDSGRYDTRDDFTVVLQPFLRDTVLPYTENGEVDSSFFAPDCFHFSSKGHAMGALNLWNNMLEPVGRKTTVWEITDLKCPTEDSPFIFTRLNSFVNDTATSAPDTTTARRPTTPMEEMTSPSAPDVVTDGAVETTTDSSIRINAHAPLQYFMLLLLVFAYYNI